MREFNMDQLYFPPLVMLHQQTWPWFCASCLRRVLVMSSYHTPRKGKEEYQGIVIALYDIVSIVP